MRTLLAVLAIAALCLIASITIVQVLASPRTGLKNPIRLGADEQRPVSNEAKDAAASGKAKDAAASGEAKDAAASGEAKDAASDEAAPRSEQLCRLSFLAGEWSSNDPRIEATASYHWSPDRTFLQGEYRVKMPGKAEVTATQWFAYDAADQMIRQWTFFADGGYGEAVWTPAGRDWIAKTWGSTGDGRYTSATMRISPTAPDHMVWKISNRVRGDRVVPESETIPMIKKPMVARR